MGKRIIRTERNSDIFLRETRVENLFINEYLPSAPGDYVRVYIFGLMAAGNREVIDNEKFAKLLGMTTEEVENAWRYWARRGIIKQFGLEGDDEYGIEFISLIDRLYSNVRNLERKEAEVTSFEEDRKITDAEEYTDDDPLDEDETYEDSAEDDAEETAAEKIVRLINEGIKNIYDEYEKQTGRLLSRTEMENIADAVHVYNINPEVMSYAIKYCVELDKYNSNYIIKVATRWTSEGCRSIGDVKEYLDKYSRRNAEYSAIFKELGFNRLPSPAEREIMSDWMDNKGFRIDEILDACRKAAGIREPSLRYVNKVLENKMREAGGIKVDYSRPTEKEGSQVYSRPDNESKAMVSKAVLEEYYEYLRQKSEKNQDARIDAVCSKYPEMRRIYEEENEINNRIIELAFTQAARQERADLKERRASMDNRKRRLLHEKGLPADYLDRKYYCRLCKDTGMTKDGLLCACREKRAEEAYKWKIEKNR